MKKLLCIIMIFSIILLIGTGCNKSEENSNFWIVSYYKDEFKESTDECYITNNKYIEGTFSNTATTDSKLYVEILADETNFSIRLLEYGKNIVKNNSSNKAVGYTIKVKYDDGKESKIYAYMQPGDDKIIIESPTGYYLASKLKEKESISFYICESRQTTTNYLFDVDSKNFQEIYDEQFG